MNTKYEEYLIAGRRYAQFGQLTEKPHNCINIQIYKCMQFILFSYTFMNKVWWNPNCRPSTSRAAGWEAPQLQIHITYRRCTWHTQCVQHITAHYRMHLSDSWLRIHTIEYIIYMHLCGFSVNSICYVYKYTCSAFWTLPSILYCCLGKGTEKNVFFMTLS